VLSADPHATFGLVSLPWYFDPPVSPYNAGAFSRSWFEDWNRAHGDRVTITGWNAQQLRSNPPTAFFLSELEAADPTRLGNPGVTEFRAALDSGYSARIRFWRAPSTFAWLAPGWSWAPPDWLYPSPRITGYYRWTE
jgi:hypothetical protein